MKSFTTAPTHMAIYCPWCTRIARDANGNALTTRTYNKRQVPCTRPDCSTPAAPNTGGK